MVETADAVVIGGGVIGASVAWHLASLGCRRVRVLDRAPKPGGGSTSRATGGYRAQFGTDINVRLSLLSREKLLRFREEVGADPGYRPRGYLFVVRRAEDFEALRAARRVQEAAGLTDPREVSPDEIARLNPAIALDGVLGGVFGPSDGFVVPMQILGGYLEAARRKGVRFDFGAECLGFRREGSRLVSIRTTQGEIAAATFVNAAGAWAAAVARLAGVELPIAPLRRQGVPTMATSLSPDLPLTIFVEDGFHFRIRDNRALLLWPDDPKPADPFDTSVDPAWIDAVERLARERVPGLAGIPLDRDAAWAGLYEMSPDGHAILGPAPGCDNLILVNGSSGHGVMHSPALGQLAAEIVLEGRARSIDVHALRPTRFAEGQPVKGMELL